MKKTLACSILLLLSACGWHSSPVIRPESLVSASAEKISFPIVDNDSVTSIEKWINTGDAPTAAVISCKNISACSSVKHVLMTHKISFKEVPPAKGADAGNISLTYNRVIARDCKPTQFGCSTSMNSVRMITNREQFLKPSLSDPQDAAGAVKAVGKYVR